MSLLFPHCLKLTKFADSLSTVSSSNTNVLSQRSQSTKEVIVRISILLLLILILQNTTVLGQVVTGHILVESTREPISYATVKLENTDNEVVRHTSTDAKGSFIIVAPKAAEYTISVTRIGYTDNMAGPYYLGEADTLNIEMRLLNKAVTLNELTVTAERDIAAQRLENNGYFRRKERSSGHFITPEDIENKNPIDLTDMFLTIQGVEVDDGLLWSKRGTSCPMRIIFNGMVVFDKTKNLTLNPTSEQINFSINNLTRPEEVLGIEVYVSMNSQPMKFGRRTRCGIVAIWTR